MKRRRREEEEEEGKMKRRWWSQDQGQQGMETHLDYESYKIWYGSLAW